MKVVVKGEPLAGERRVAATPETVGLLRRAGLDVWVEPEAGLASGATDVAYRAGEATVEAVAAGDGEVLLHVRPLSPETIKGLRPGTITIGFCNPAGDPASVAALRDQGVTSFAMELVPRISRAQSMDALTSQALVAGYRGVLEAAVRLPRFYPLFMTAAGTVPPSKVLVLGAGVAGLQAIATAKRLGAVVSAYDVRPTSADEVRSMGGTFIDLKLDVLEGSGGYAREMSEDRALRQQELLTPYLAEADVVITTAAVPGRPAPRLVTALMVAQMRPGSVIVDLAAETGGNVEGSRPGEDVLVPVAAGEGSVTIYGAKDIASTMPVDASRLYAKNVANLLLLMTKDGEVVPDFTDEVVAGSCLTHGGQVLHLPSAENLVRLGLAPAPPESDPEVSAEPDGSENSNQERTGAE